MAAHGGVGKREGRSPAVTAVLAAVLLLLTRPGSEGRCEETAGTGMRAARFLPKEEQQTDAESAVVRQNSSGPRQDSAQPAESVVATAMRNDAALADVCFVDPQRGWAVGDRGTIWHTRDGGQQWFLQRSGVSCRLESISFVSAQVGWVAGGYSHPYSHTGAGVILYTEDGGLHWNRHTKLLLPPLRRVQMFGSRAGVALAYPSAMYPSGVFTTDNGGRSWSQVPGERKRGAQVGDFLDVRLGAIAGNDAPAAVVGRMLVQSQPIEPGLGLRAPARLELTPPNGGWLVGQGGLVLRTADQGRSWRLPPGELAPLRAGQFDFAALEVRGPKCWIAGNPGTRVFFTPDAGATWSAFPTGQSLPLNAISFVDDEHGWAVGPLGTILASIDGGRTWTRQRSGGTRVALLGLFSDPKDIPWELFVRLSGNEGYLSAVEVVHRRDVDSPPRDEIPPGDRIHEAMACAGGCYGRAAWEFPLRQPGLEVPAEQVFQAWSRVHDRPGEEVLENHLVQVIRAWRPEIIVTHDAASDSISAKLLGQAVLKAVAVAAQGDARGDSAESIGLQPWQVKRVMSSLGPDAAGSVQVASNQLADRLGCALEDVAARARASVDDRFRVSPVSLGFQSMFDSSAPDRKARDFFADLAVAPGGEARRAIVVAGPEAPELVRRLAQRRRTALAVVEHSGRDPRTRAAMLAETRSLTEGLDNQAAATLLYQLGQNYYRSGHWEMATEVFEILCEAYEDEPLTRSAQVWLIEYHASSEARWRIEGPRRGAVVQTTALAADPRNCEPQARRALTLGSRLQQTRPDLYAQPAIGFVVAAVDRVEQPRMAERFYSVQRTSAIDRAWKECAQAEQWLAERRGTPAKPVLHCRRATSKPHLDGKLDDSLWANAEAVPLRSALGDDGAWPASVKLAYDREFLYLAIEARQAPGVRYESTPGPRTRDANLSSRDRVELCIDLDRDFATYYRLAIDHRGWTHDDCWGDSTWNPTWYVVAAAADGGWTAEAAIPMDQLTGRSPDKSTAWAIGIQRIVPGVGFQSWNTPAAIDVIPEGFGYLVFE
jgi:photosystem II stability/assembly factor-like uncharacterized protein